MIVGSITRPLLGLVVGLSYLSVLLIHEYGHVVAARRKHCAVSGIELYPICGLVRIGVPWSRYDHCVIAWGGVIAQAIVGLPLMVVVTAFGYTPFEPLNAALAILGGYSLFVAALNLLPIPPLDGAIAWGIVPAYIQRLRSRRTKRAAAWRGR